MSRDLIALVLVAASSVVSAEPTFEDNSRLGVEAALSVAPIGAPYLTAGGSLRAEHRTGERQSITLRIAYATGTSIDDDCGAGFHTGGLYAAYRWYSLHRAYIALEAGAALLRHRPYADDGSCAPFAGSWEGLPAAAVALGGRTFGRLDFGVSAGYPWGLTAHLGFDFAGL